MIIIIRRKMVKKRIFLHISHPEVISHLNAEILKLCFSTCAHFSERSYEYEFQWKPNKGYSSNFTAENILLTFQMEQNGMFLENYKYDYWILHTKLF